MHQIVSEDVLVGAVPGSDSQAGPHTPAGGEDQLAVGFVVDVDGCLAAADVGGLEVAHHDGDPFGGDEERAAAAARGGVEFEVGDRHVEVWLEAVRDCG